MKRLQVLFLVGLLAGCETVPRQEAVADPEGVWQEHRQRLSGLRNWTLTGRISVFSDEDAWHASLRWNQREAAYDIAFVGPLGQGSMMLRGTPEGVVMQNSENETYRADTPDVLLLRHMGWRVPLSGLRFWAVGLPDPDIPARPVIDQRGRLASLLQSGWKIDILRYQTVGGIDLPRKIFMKHAQLDVRLVIDNWIFTGRSE